MSTNSVRMSMIRELLPEVRRILLRDPNRATEAGKLAGRLYSFIQEMEPRQTARQLDHLMYLAKLEEPAAFHRWICDRWKDAPSGVRGFPEWVEEKGVNAASAWRTVPYCRWLAYWISIGNSNPQLLARVFADLEVFVRPYVRCNEHAHFWRTVESHAQESAGDFTQAHQDRLGAIARFYEREFALLPAGGALVSRENSHRLAMRVCAELCKEVLRLRSWPGVHGSHDPTLGVFYMWQLLRLEGYDTSAIHRSIIDRIQSAWPVEPWRPETYLKENFEWLTTK